MEIKFRSCYTPIEKIAQDLSRTHEDVYKYLEPYAVDLESGEILNKSSSPKLVKVGTINIYERIQEYKDSVDLYTIIEKALTSGDMNILNRRTGSFCDIADLPDNIHDFNKVFDDKVKILGNLPNNVSKAILDDSVPLKDINSLISAEVQKQLLNTTNKDKEKVGE